jgi:hypothetical protein
VKERRTPLVKERRARRSRQWHLPSFAGATSHLRPWLQMFPAQQSCRSAPQLGGVVHSQPFALFPSQSENVALHVA